MSGKLVRMGRLFQADGRAVMVPIDHGVTSGPIGRLRDAAALLEALASGHPDAIILHRGLLLAGLVGGRLDCGLIVHLSAGTSLSYTPHVKVAIGHVEDALALGADAVSIHVTLGAEYEREMLSDLGTISGYCQKWGVPLMAMMYVHNVPVAKEPAAIAHAARLAAELGADVVKVKHPGSFESFRAVTAGCFVPVVTAGGERVDDDRAILKLADESVRAGAAGVAIGRNIFQHPRPAVMLSALKMIVHDGSASTQVAEASLTPELSSATPELAAPQRASATS